MQTWELIKSHVYALFRTVCMSFLLIIDLRFTSELFCSLLLLSYLNYYWSVIDDKDDEYQKE